MSYQAINFADKLQRIDAHWTPKVIAELNSAVPDAMAPMTHQFKLVKIQGEFVWHSHADTDEVFVVLDGRMAIDFRDGRVELGTGEMFVVPRGVEHKPSAEQECRMLLIEPRGVVNTGDAGGALTAPGDAWI